MHTPIVALIYDFDKTLSPKDMQEYSFIPGLNMEADAFWGLCRDLSLRTNMDGILAYMYMMKKMAEGTMELSREALSKLGEKGGVLPRGGDVVRPRGRDRAAKRRLRGALHHLLRASGDHPRLAHRRPLQGGVRRLVLLRRARARRMAGLRRSTTPPRRSTSSASTRAYSTSPTTATSTPTRPNTSAACPFPT